MRRDQRGAFPLATVMGGTIAALAIAFFAAVLLPVTDSALGADAAGGARKYSDEAVDGRKIYVREGCFTCHSQMVRDVEADRLIGRRVSEAGDYFNEAPSLIGLDRIGPDLSCAGDREKNVDAVMAHLRRPGSVNEGSTMPSYAYLKAGELRALATYIVALTCGGSSS